MKRKKYYASKIAISARKLCVDKKVIDENTKTLNFETLQKIVNIFGGNLFKNGNSPSYYKHKNSSFDICIGNDVKLEDESLTILMALGIAFFDFEKLSEGCEINISEDKIYDNSVISINEMLWFSREFLMPEKLYDESMIENMTKDGKFDCIGIAEDFGTDYMKVLARGEDLGKWH